MILAGGTACIISLLFATALYKLYEGGKIDQLEWDLATVTAGDYSVEFDIPKKAYKDWYENIYKQSGGECE